MQELIDKQIEYGKKPSVLEAYDKEWAARGDAYSEGYDSGFEEGQTLGQATILQKFLESGMSIEEISKITNISIKDIKSLIDKK